MIMEIRRRKKKKRKGNEERTCVEQQVEDSEGAICVEPVSFGFVLSKLTFQRSRVMLLFFTRSADSH